MDSQIKVTVIIPTYKRSAVIQRAVDSVLRQTLDSYEVIVVDDNGIDTIEGRLTAKKMEKYNDDSKVIYIQHENNKNGAAARNSGIRLARGRYITFLDDDDVYIPERLQMMCDKMDALDSSWGACYTGYVKHNANGDQYSAETAEGDVYIQALMRSLYIGTGSNLFFRKEVIANIGFFDETFKRNQDLEYLVRVLKKYKMAYVDKVLMEAFYDIRTVILTYSQSLERENNFRKKFNNYLDVLSPNDKKRVEIMYDIDWIRGLISNRHFLWALKKIINSHIPIIVWRDYIKYIFDRSRNNTCYGFVVKLKEE